MPVRIQYDSDARSLGEGNLAIYKKNRLDQILVARGLAATRSQARDLIRRGCVTVAGRTVTKPAAGIEHDADIRLAEGAAPYVSRGGLKLAAAVEAFGFDPYGLYALDIGSSTGGFTDVLLQRGAARVHAVDVGQGQLRAELLADQRVVALEGVDARDLRPEMIEGRVEAIVADVSFISLTLALPAALALAAPGAWLVALIKPQFEAGRDAIGKGGIVREEPARAAAVEKVRSWLGAQPGWTLVGVIPSPLEGGSGNVEYLIGARRG